jgi:hypothetical protein
VSVPFVPEQNPNQSELWLPRVLNPYVGLWFNTTEMKGVPENIVGWMVSAGWEVTNIIEDTRTVPSTKKFDLMRPEKMKPWEVLLSLCNHYTIAANEARGANQIRYNQIVRNWTEMIDTSHDQFNAQTADHNAQVVMYLGDLDAYMDAIESLINSNQAQIVIDANEAKVALGTIDLRLTDLETNAQNSAITIGSLLTRQNTNLQTFINDYNAKLAELDQNYAAYLANMLSQISSLGNVLDSHVADYQSQIGILSTNYNSHLSTINGLLNNITNNVNTYTAEVNDILNSIEGDYFAVEADLTNIRAQSGVLGSRLAVDYNDILDLLINEYQVHEGIARGFLDNLGATELARINEQFQASLSAQLQRLTSQGLAVSAIVSDVTARNHRDRDEQIQALNDRLMRERLENQHRLYGQQVALRGQMIEGKMQIHAVQQEVLRYQASLVTGINSLLQETRNRILAGKQAVFAARDANHKFGVELRTNLYAQLQDVRQRTIDSTERVYQLRDIFAKWRSGETGRLYEQLQQVESQFIAAIGQQNAAQQDVVRAEIGQRDNLFQQLQGALSALLQGKDRYASALMQISSTLADHKHRAIIERMNTAAARLDGLKMTADQNRALMAYQLDERNKLLIGLYSFVERREDAAPEWRDMSTMIAGLGDAGGGWLSPN